MQVWFRDNTNRLIHFEPFEEIDTSFSDLSFEELFADELRFLKNKQQPNFHISTMNLGFEDIFKEELVVLGQTFVNKESKFKIEDQKFKMHNTINTYLQLPQISLKILECLEFKHIINYIILGFFKIRGRIFSNKVGFDIEYELFMFNFSFYIFIFLSHYNDKKNLFFSHVRVSYSFEEKKEDMK